MPTVGIIHAITFALVDLIKECLGKQGALYVVYTAFQTSLLLTAHILCAIWLPHPPCARLLMKSLNPFLWDAKNIVRKLKNYPATVEVFFGTAWQQAFCS